MPAGDTEPGPSVPLTWTYHRITLTHDYCGETRNLVISGFSPDTCQEPASISQHVTHKNINISFQAPAVQVIFSVCGDEKAKHLDPKYKSKRAGNASHYCNTVPCLF